MSLSISFASVCTRGWWSNIYGHEGVLALYRMSLTDLLSEYETEKISFEGRDGDILLFSCTRRLDNARGVLMLPILYRGRVLPRPSDETAIQNLFGDIVRELKRIDREKNQVFRDDGMSDLQNNIQIYNVLTTPASRTPGFNSIHPCLNTYNEIPALVLSSYDTTLNNIPGSTYSRYYNWEEMAIQLCEGLVYIHSKRVFFNDPFRALPFNHADILCCVNHQHENDESQPQIFYRFSNFTNASIAYEVEDDEFFLSCCRDRSRVCDLLLAFLKKYPLSPQSTRVYTMLLTVVISKNLCNESTHAFYQLLDQLRVRQQDIQRSKSEKKEYTEPALKRLEKAMRKVLKRLATREGLFAVGLPATAAAVYSDKRLRTAIAEFAGALGAVVSRPVAFARSVEQGSELLNSAGRLWEALMKSFFVKYVVPPAALAAILKFTQEANRYFTAGGLPSVIM